MNRQIAKLWTSFIYVLLDKNNIYELCNFCFIFIIHIYFCDVILPLLNTFFNHTRAVSSSENRSRLIIFGLQLIQALKLLFLTEFDKFSKVIFELYLSIFKSLNYLSNFCSPCCNNHVIWEEKTLPHGFTFTFERCQTSSNSASTRRRLN